MQQIHVRIHQQTGGRFNERIMYLTISLKTIAITVTFIYDYS